jgi:phosphoribosylanthranilate isomerase
MFVKVCGLSTPESIREAVDAGADAVGFVLTASPRAVSPAQVTKLLSEVPGGVAAVGVFRHEPAADAVAIARAAGLDWIQLHGARTPGDV